MKSWDINNFEEFQKEILQTDGEQLALLNSANIMSAYSRFEIPKKKAEYRILYAIDRNTVVGKLQTRLYHNFLKNLYWPDYVYGFKKECSYFDYLSYHLTSNANTCFLALDIKEFFDHISVDRVKDALSFYISDQCPKEDRKKILETFITITTLDNRFVQGAITSPAISNLAFRQADMRIDAYCMKLGVKYSRYADDLLFSCPSQLVHKYRFESAIRHIVGDMGFQINHHKTQKQQGTLCLNGYVVNSSIHLSRRKLSALTGVLWEMKQKGYNIKNSGHTKEGIKNFLAGYRSYLIQAKRYCEQEEQLEYMNTLIIKTEAMIDQYCK